MHAGLVKCVGVCLQAFHAKCLGLEGPPPADWWCAQCRSERMRCFVCGGFGAGMTDAAVRKCSLGCCGRFYHVRSAWGIILQGWGPQAASTMSGWHGAECVFFPSMGAQFCLFHRAGAHRLTRLSAADTGWGAAAASAISGQRVCVLCFSQQGGSM